MAIYLNVKIKYTDTFLILVSGITLVSATLANAGSRSFSFYYLESSKLPNHQSSA